MRRAGSAFRSARLRWTRAAPVMCTHGACLLRNAPGRTPLPWSPGDELDLVAVLVLQISGPVLRAAGEGSKDPVFLAARKLTASLWTGPIGHPQLDVVQPTRPRHEAPLHDLASWSVEHGGGRPSHRSRACPWLRRGVSPRVRPAGTRCKRSRSTPPTVATKIKLMRLGKMRAPYYRIVVADARTKRDGRS